MNNRFLPARTVASASFLLSALASALCIPALPSQPPGPMTLPYATRLGPDKFTGNMAVEPNGNVFVAKAISSQESGHPTTDGTTVTAAQALWIVRLDPTSTGGPDPNNPSLVWGTIINGLTQPRATAVGPNGDLYMTGWTSTAGLGSAGAYDATFNGGRTGFVARVDGDDGTLVAFTYFGSSDTTAEGIGIGPSGEVAIGGWTDLAIPTTSTAFLTQLTVGDPFVAVFDANLSNAGGPDGDGLLYASYLPSGTTFDTATDVDVDAAGALWVCGTFDSSSAVPTGLFTNTPGGAGEGFLLKIDPAQSGAASLAWARFFGGSGDDAMEQVTVDAAGNGWLVGTTGSSDLLGGGFNGATDAVVAAFSPSGTLLSAAYLGGSKADTGVGVAIDGQGRVVVAGSTQSANFPVTSNAYDSTHNSRRKDDVFVARLDGALQPTDATFVGGSKPDTCTSLGLDLDGNAYVGGAPTSGNFPQTLSTFETEGFVAKIAFGIPPQPGGVTVVLILPDTMNAGSTTAVSITGSGFQSGAAVTFANGSGPSPTASNVVVMNDMQIQAVVSVSGGGPPGARVWDVVVTNPDSSNGTLPGGFTVIK